MKWLRQRFELSRDIDGSNVRPMEGMRGFAVFLVFLVHYVTLMEPWLDHHSSANAIAGGLHTIGNSGVDLFFVLSGYLIYGTLISKKRKFGTFIARRVRRIYPAFAAVFLLYVALSFASPAQSKIPKEWGAAAMYLTQNFLLLPGLFPIEPMITVAWSLSYEMLFYLLLPLVVGLFALRRRSPAWRVTLFVGAAAVLTFYCAAYAGPVRLIMFISGIVMYETMRGSAVRPTGIAGLLAVSLGLGALLIPTHGSAGYAAKVSLLFVAFFVFCLSCFARPNEWLGRAFSWWVLRWLGNMSYSYYLVHGLALHAMVALVVRPQSSFAHGVLFFWLMLPLMFVWTLLPAAVLFLTVERPLSLPTKSRIRRVTVVGSEHASAA